MLKLLKSFMQDESGKLLKITQGVLCAYNVKNSCYCCDDVIFWNRSKIAASKVALLSNTKQSTKKYSAVTERGFCKSVLQLLANILTWRFPFQANFPKNFPWKRIDCKYLTSYGLGHGISNRQKFYARPQSQVVLCGGHVWPLQASEAIWNDDNN